MNVCVCSFSQLIIEKGWQTWVIEINDVDLLWRHDKVNYSCSKHNEMLGKIQTTKKLIYSLEIPSLQKQRELKPRVTRVEADSMTI